MTIEGALEASILFGTVTLLCAWQVAHHRRMEREFSEDMESLKRIMEECKRREEELKEKLK